MSLHNMMVNPNDHSPIIPPELAAFRKIDSIVNKTHLTELEKYEIQDIPDLLKERDVSDSACLFPITRFVYDKNESTRQKLTSVYASAASAGINVAMLVKISRQNGTQIYLGACDEDGRENGALPKAQVLYNSFVGNFPGCRHTTDTPILNSSNTQRLINDAFSSSYSSVASVSAVASLRGQQQDNKNDTFFQGIEKTIEAMNGQDCTILVIAKALSSDDIREIQEELEMLYTQLVPFSKVSFSINQSCANSVSKTISDTLSTTVSNTKSHTLSVGESSSTSKGTNQFKSSGFNLGGNLGIGGKDSPFSVSGGYFRSWGSGTSTSETVGQNKTVADAVAEATAEAKAQAISNGETESLTDGQAVQISYENKTIINVLSQIEQQLKRLKTGSSLGMFATATYFVSNSSLNVRTGANAYKAVVSGDNTYLESSGINVWNGTDYTKILPYISQLCHPVFITDSLGKRTTTTPATIVSSAELAIHMSLPKSSVQCIPVRESVSFGRSITSLNPDTVYRNDIDLGSIFHLGCSDYTPAYLNLDSLTMHTFITGTTGSGKSNTIYGLMDKIRAKRNSVHFMVIEPAKGEYKAVFGSDSDFTVYGTNPYVTKLLRINPFRFDKHVHILEHIDRLISIFNVCWPMEAAMPAVLKQAIERSYKSAGWDLKRSTNSITDNMFPNFDDVMHEVENIMDESMYSSDNKGDYKGALCTRLSELTTGLNSMIFVPNDIPDNNLFDENVIIDLSRIGSSETKSLIMGLMIIKLQEYRQGKQKSPNEELKHITILEEAHHLLKRTSTQQSMDSANIAGKSVEMISNALAEMRSYGEGFIIADQSPEQMDMSAIRNTNTKIIMRLPAYEDRKLVGKAATLNDSQIDELAKLPTGVAAVYQNDWMESVLVKMPRYKNGSAHFENAPEENEMVFTDADVNSLLYAIMHKNGIENMVDNLEGEPIDAVASMHLPTRVKIQVINYIKNTDRDRLDRLGKVAFEFFNMREAMLIATTDSLPAWRDDVLSLLEPSVADFDDWDKDMLLIILGHEYALRNPLFKPIYIELCQRLA